MTTFIYPSVHEFNNVLRWAYTIQNYRSIYNTQTLFIYTESEGDYIFNSFFFYDFFQVTIAVFL